VFQAVSLLLILGAFPGVHAVTSLSSDPAIATTSPPVSKSVPVTVEATPVDFPLQPNSVRFGVIGDSGTGSSAQYEMAREMLAIHKATNFGFVIMLGDNLYGGHAPGDFADKFERPYKPLLDRGVEFYASLGNHDSTSEVTYAPFHMGGQRYYTFSKGNVQFFVLDSNYMSGEQLDWLKSEMQKSIADWKIAYFHHPLYSNGKRHGGDNNLRAILVPVFRQYGVNVVLSGHDHVYERITPQDGTVYFVLGNSGQLRSGGLDKTEEEAAGYDHDRCFMIMEAVGNRLYFKTISRTGEIVDSGILTRRAAVGTGATSTPPTQ
jgi:Calcineurin-like phosphoesterase